MIDTEVKIKAFNKLTEVINKATSVISVFQRAKERDSSDMFLNWGDPKVVFGDELFEVLYPIVIKTIQNEISKIEVLRNGMLK